jgi:F-type H+-transporting ATPase subunit delta
MRNSILASRYARALYTLAKETNQHELVFDEMRAVEEAFLGDQDIWDFLQSPMVRPVDKVKALEAAFGKISLSETTCHFLLLLARKGRLLIFSDVVVAYQAIADEAHGVTRGVVRSATLLGPDDRKRIEELVSRATKKQVILTYKEDSTLLGGLVAEVGSFTFDDSLTSHLNRINEQLTRSVH